MWYQQKANGRWQFFERYEEDVTHLKKTVSVTLDKNTTATRKLAQRLLEDKIRSRQVSVGQYREMTLKELSELYLARDVIRESTRLRDTDQIASILAILDENAHVNDLSYAYIREKLAAAGESNRAERITRIKSFLRWGYKNDYIENISYLDKLSVPKAQNEISDKYLEADELKQLLDNMPIDEWRNLTEFLALSGLRIGEAIDLTYEDIDGDLIYVNSTYGLRTKESGPTKTARSTREVTIMPELARCLSRTHALRMKKRVVSRYVFTSPAGFQVPYDTYRQYFGDCCERAIGRRLSPHALRHTYTSLMAAAGVPLEVIARQLGHENSRITREVYFHVTKKLKEKDTELIKSVRLLG